MHYSSIFPSHNALQEPKTTLELPSTFFTHSVQASNDQPLVCVNISYVIHSALFANWEVGVIGICAQENARDGS